ncbi:MAG: PilZ domain-containing protein [Candidatus Omnitrophica bacterium]|nr:PilZ domain-containing protein [Candidatus Omnitrophota bacterium]
MKKIEERRRFIRLEVPVEVKYIMEGDTLRKEVTTKDLSCEGLRFTSAEEIKNESKVELNLNIPNANNAVHIKGKIVWSKRISIEDGSPKEVGVEFLEIEEDNKNTFLRFLCDLIYGQTKKMEQGNQ